MRNMKIKYEGYAKCSVRNDNPNLTRDISITPDGKTVVVVVAGWPYVNNLFLKFLVLKGVMKINSDCSL